MVDTKKVIEVQNAMTSLEVEIMGQIGFLNALGAAQKTDMDEHWHMSIVQVCKTHNG